MLGQMGGIFAKKYSFINFFDSAYTRLVSSGLFVYDTSSVVDASFGQVLP